MKQLYSVNTGEQMFGAFYGWVYLYLTGSKSSSVYEHGLVVGARNTHSEMPKQKDPAGNNRTFMQEDGKGNHSLLLLYAAKTAQTTRQ